MKNIKKAISLFTICAIILNLMIYIAPTKKVVAAQTPGIKSGTIYHLKNLGSGKYLNVHNGVTANNTNVYQWTKDNSSEQKFIVFYDSYRDSYHLLPMCVFGVTGIAVDVTSVSNGGNAIVTKTYLTSTQFFKFHQVSQGVYKISHKDNPNLLLTAYGNSNGTASGTTPTSAGNVFLSTSNGSLYQQWVLEESIMSTSLKDAMPTRSTSDIKRVHGSTAFIQEFLNEWNNNNALTIDGKYGPLTANAVKAFQSYYGLTADGICGPKTWAKIQSLLYLEFDIDYYKGYGVKRKNGTLSPSIAVYSYNNWFWESIDGDLWIMC